MLSFFILLKRDYKNLVMMEVEALLVLLGLHCLGSAVDEGPIPDPEDRLLGLGPLQQVGSFVGSDSELTSFGFPVTTATQ